MKLDVILRTHDASNVHVDRDRYTGLTKFETIDGCLNSLVNTMNDVDDELFLTVLDDHSTERMLDRITQTLVALRHPYTVVLLDEVGYNHSALEQFTYCRNSNADLVYSVEDDYLHSPHALGDMIENYELFKNKTGREICIYPFDMPDDYEPPWMEQCFLVHGTKQHWRTGVWTTNTFMCRPQVLQDHWPTFEKLAKEYSPIDCLVHEGNTICDVWRNHVLRFSPVPSLALHLQFDTQQDPYLDWKLWWDHYSKLVHEKEKS